VKVVVVVMIYTDPSELFKIFPIVTHLNAKLQNLYLAKQNIVTDEFLTLWRGCLSFWQCLSLESAKL
jgi:hypothetical protein